MPQKEIELILTRQWASYLAMPVWVMGADETLLYYNEPAEPLIGRRFDETGAISLDEMPNLFQITSEDGTPLSPEDIPPGIALREQRPVHMPVRFRGLDGVWRRIAVTAFPIEGQGGRHLGAVAIFWEAPTS